MEVKTDPLEEAIAEKLLGIDTVPLKERRRMVRRAAKAAAELALKRAT